MIKKTICCLLIFIMLFGLLPFSSQAEEEENLFFPVELRTSDREFIRNCELEVKFSDSGIAMARFDTLCDLLDLESRTFSDYYVCRKKGLVTGSEPANPVGDEISEVLGRYQFVFVNKSDTAVQLNYIFGPAEITLPEETLMMDGSLFVPLASFVCLNSGYVKVENNKIIMNRPYETITDILGWEASRSLWTKYYFDPIEFINNCSSGLLGSNPSQVVYIWDGIYECFHDIFNALFTFDYSGMFEDMTGEFASDYGAAMAQAICSKVPAEQLAIEELEEIGRFDIDAMEAFASKFVEANGEVIKDIEAQSDVVFDKMLDGTIAMESGFDKIGELTDRMGRQKSEQAFYKAISNKTLTEGIGVAFGIFTSYCTIVNEVDKSSNFDIDAMNRYVDISNGKNTAVEPEKVREGLTEKTKWFYDQRSSSFNDRLTEAIVSEFEKLSWSTVGGEIGSVISQFPKGAALTGDMTYKVIGLVWNLIDAVIAEVLGDMGDIKLAINLNMLTDSAFRTYKAENSSGQDRYENRLALVYVYLKACYASRQLMFDYMDRSYFEEGFFEEYFAEDLQTQKELGDLLAKLSTTEDMGADCRLFDGLAVFDGAFSQDLSKSDKLIAQQYPVPAEYNQNIGQSSHSIITLGNYEQDDNYSNGPEPIEWIALAKKEDNILVTSRFVLDCVPFNITADAVSWETSYLRAWLNDSFYNEAFSGSNKAKIVDSEVYPHANPQHDTDPGNTTNDKVFLLSLLEVDSLFASAEDIACYPTQYAIRRGVDCSSKWLSGWWLRTPGMDESHAATWRVDNKFGYAGRLVNYVGRGVRPAMWVKAEYFPDIAELGSLSDYDYTINVGDSVPVATNQFNGNEYAVYDIPMTWSRAESFCESLGGHLACISSEAENEFVLNLISAGSKNLYWLGGSRINNSSDWGWVTGESYNYFNWGNNKPDNYDSVEDKLQMYRNSTNNNPVGSWNDASDSGAGYHSEFYELTNTGFVCEWGISSNVPPQDGSIELTDYIDGIGADITSRMAEVADLLQGVVRTNNADYPDACYEGNGILLGYNDEWGFFCIIDRNLALKVHPVEIGMNVDQVESAFSYLSEGWYRFYYDSSNSTIRVSIGDSEFYVLNYDADGRITRIQYSIEYSG